MTADRETYAERARIAHDHLCRRFERPDGMLRRDGVLHRPRTVAHLWPLARAIVATLDLMGVTAGHGGDLEAVIGDRLAALERYWDSAVGAYASDPPGTRIGGDIYYDDNAWVGLALAQLERQRPGTSRLDRAAAVFAFAQTGWSTDSELPHPGGVFWVRQGTGAGARNHDRNAVSTAPNAQVGLHLIELGAAVPGSRSAPAPGPGPEQMAEWVIDTLDAGGDGAGPFWDKIRGDGTIDRAIWSYNQGSMAGLCAGLARRGGPEGQAWLVRAQTIAARALDHLDRPAALDQPAAFDAILCRNLLLVCGQEIDAALRARIDAAVRGRADALWARARDGLLGSRWRVTLLDQSALVSVHALAAWDPADYGRLA